MKLALDELNASDYCIILDYEEVRATTRGTPIQGVRFNVMLCKDADDKKRKLLINEKLKLYNAQAGEQL